jgi:hypothetical protein
MAGGIAALLCVFVAACGNPMQPAAMPGMFSGLPAAIGDGWAPLHAA